MASIRKRRSTERHTYRIVLLDRINVNLKFAIGKVFVNHKLIFWPNVLARSLADARQDQLSTQCKGLKGQCKVLCVYLNRQNSRLNSGG
jgi:hypothetical protein